MDCTKAIATAAFCAFCIPYMEGSPSPKYVRFEIDLLGPKNVSHDPRNFFNQRISNHPHVISVVQVFRVFVFLQNISNMFVHTRIM